MKKLILFTFLLSTNVFANEPYAQVKKIQAIVNFNGKPLALNQIITNAGKLESTVGSFVVLEFLKNKDFMRVNESSSMEISPPNAQNEQTLKIHSGVARVEIQKSDSKKTRFSIKSSAATMGVRGTNFFAKADPVLGETELIVFDGTVAFSSNKNPSDSKMIQKGQWGGIGGRFGEKTSAVLTLPASLLKAVDGSASL